MAKSKYDIEYYVDLYDAGVLNKADMVDLITSGMIDVNELPDNILVSLSGTNSSGVKEKNRGETIPPQKSPALNTAIKDDYEKYVYNILYQYDNLKIDTFDLYTLIKNKRIDVNDLPKDVVENIEEELDVFFDDFKPTKYYKSPKPSKSKYDFSEYDYWDEDAEDIKAKKEKENLNFAPAAKTEDIVFGAAAPGRYEDFTPKAIHKWLDFMKAQGIERVLPLIEDSKVEEIKKYSNINIIEMYYDTFGVENVLWVPIADYTLVSKKTLVTQIIPFLKQSVEENKKTVVHCSAGIGRTGHILAAWLTYGRGYTVQEAIKEVEKSDAHRNPSEAVRGYKGITVLEDLLDPFSEEKKKQVKEVPVKKDKTPIKKEDNPYPKGGVQSLEGKGRVKKAVMGETYLWDGMSAMVARENDKLTIVWKNNAYWKKDEGAFVIIIPTQYANNLEIQKLFSNSLCRIRDLTDMECFTTTEHLFEVVSKTDLNLSKKKSPAKKVNKGV